MSLPASPKFVYAMSTHPGRVRAGNEDTCAADPELGAFVVCDGMGGAAAGEEASQLAAAVFLGTLRTGTGAGEPRLWTAIEAANLAVHRKSLQIADLRGMGTTLVAALLDAEKEEAGQPTPPGKLWIAHVGDSRGYLHRGGRLHRLTGDHSLVEEQVRAGLLTQAGADASPMRHMITRAIGSQPEVDPEIRGIDTEHGDLVLLASDGLNSELTDLEIDAILTAAPPGGELQAACDALIDAANRRGGRDNVTVLLLRIV